MMIRTERGMNCHKMKGKEPMIDASIAFLAFAFLFLAAALANLLKGRKVDAFIMAAFAAFCILAAQL